MSDTHDTKDASGLRTDTPLTAMPPPDAAPVTARDRRDVTWYEDGGRKTALGIWAAAAVLAYAGMQVSGWFADWPFVALVVGSVAYFAVRGVAVVLREVSRRGDDGPDTGDEGWDVG